MQKYDHQRMRGDDIKFIYIINVAIVFFSFSTSSASILSLPPLLYANMLCARWRNNLSFNSCISHIFGTGYNHTTSPVDIVPFFSSRFKDTPSIQLEYRTPLVEHSNLCSEILVKIVFIHKFLLNLVAQFTFYEVIMLCTLNLAIHNNICKEPLFLIWFF